MNKNILIVLVGGFLIAVLVAVLVQSTLNGSKKPKAEDIAMTEILVAAKNLSVGQEIDEGDMMWKAWPKEAVFNGAVMRTGEETAAEALEGKLLRSLAEGQPATLNIITQEDKGDFLSASIKPGMRAVSLSVKSYKIADRLIRPGDFVDVIVTYRVRFNSRENPEASALINRYASETILENVRVLAIDKNSTMAVDEEEEGSKKKKKKKKSKKKATITLELDSAGVEMLVLAEEVGAVDVALRSMGDNNPVASKKSTTDVEMSKVLTELSTMKGTGGVRVYNGAEIEEVTARRNKKPTGTNYKVEDKPSEERKISSEMLLDLLSGSSDSENEEE